MLSETQDGQVVIADALDTTGLSMEEVSRGVQTITDIMKIPYRASRKYGLIPDYTRDSNLVEVSRRTLDSRYMLIGERYQDAFMRVADYGASDKAHAGRLYDIFSNHLFMPATPILTNLGASTGLTISCFLNDCPDSVEGIISLFGENTRLGSNGGGLGSYFGELRSVGEEIGGEERKMVTSGVIPFLRIIDSLSMAISQGGLRRAVTGCYLPIWHPEIEEFIDIRKPTGGDPNRKALNLHHGVIIDDRFMRCVRDDLDYELVSPKTKQVLKVVKARSLWIRLLTARLEQGEPYIINIDAINRVMPEFQRQAGLSVKSSNLCAEITLPCGLDQFKKMRTAVCCLGSFNLRFWDVYKNDRQVFRDVFRFMDNVLEDFIQNAKSRVKNPDGVANAVYSAMRERSIGVGQMGWHDYLQKRFVAWEDPRTLAIARKISRHIRQHADACSYELALERGPNPDAADKGVMERFSCKLAIAPTASISCIAGGIAPGIETRPANTYTQKTIAGSTPVRNPILAELLAEKGLNTDEVWSSITLNKGSVQHLDFLSDEEKEVYRTAMEINQDMSIRQYAARGPFICQSAANNVYLPADVHKWHLHHLHYLTWELGGKSLYYCRSQSLGRPDDVSNSATKGGEKSPQSQGAGNVPEVDLGDCLACQ